MMEYRIEHDSLGEVRVPADHMWGAQTQRSFENFKIGRKMPEEIIHAFAVLKNVQQRSMKKTVISILKRVRQSVKPAMKS